MNKFQRYIKNQLVWLDIAVNATFGGSPYETISERAYRRKCTWAVAAIDFVFNLLGEKDHCKNSAEGDEGQYEVL